MNERLNDSLELTYTQLQPRWRVACRQGAARATNYRQLRATTPHPSPPRGASSGAAPGAMRRQWSPSVHWITTTQRPRSPREPPPGCTARSRRGVRGASMRKARSRWRERSGLEEGRSAVLSRALVLAGRIRCAAGKRRCVGPLGRTTPHRGVQHGPLSAARRASALAEAELTHAGVAATALSGAAAGAATTWRAPTHRWPARSQATRARDAYACRLLLRWCRQRGGAGSVRAGVAA